MAIVTSGTKEWSEKSVNCCNGCEHNCRYCYAKWNAVDRFEKMSSEEWETKRIRPHDVKKKHKKYDGTVMFPTTHDICPSILDECLEVLDNLFKSGNDVLIVSKPHLDCIKAICDRFAGYKDKLLFRFTIGAFDNEILKYWEPGAPTFEERFACLKFAHDMGFKTSISTEPMLDAANVVNLFYKLAPYINDAMWIGKMNKIDSRVHVVDERDRIEADKIKNGQTDDRIWDIYKALKDEPKIKWKESVKDIVGIDRPNLPGLDV